MFLEERDVDYGDLNLSSRRQREIGIRDRVGIAPAAREIAFAQTDENGGHACIPAFALQAFKDFDNAVLGIVRRDVNGHECRVCGIESLW